MDEAHEEQADRLEREADSLERASDRVGDMIKDTREDWEQKKSSSPGAANPEEAAPGGLGEEPDNAENADAQSGGPA